MLKGIDISEWQGKVDFAKVKSKVDFAILRLGYGDDLPRQDDKKFNEYVAECEKFNIPYGVYIYSYAINEAMVDSEIAHTLRVIGSKKPFCVFYDMEDKSTVSVGKSKLTAFAKRFCNGIKAKGYKVGVYANENWFRNYLDVKALHKQGYVIWCAKYSESKPNISAPYDIWQYASNGKVDGINGNVDVNYMLTDIIQPKKSNEEIAQEVIEDKWGVGLDRRNRLTEAGYNYSEVQEIVTRIMNEKENVVLDKKKIAKEVIQGKWGNGKERRTKLSNAGYNPSEIQAIVNEMLR